jgi:hypothetical protein
MALGNTAVIAGNNISRRYFTRRLPWRLYLARARGGGIRELASRAGLRSARAPIAPGGSRSDLDLEFDIPARKYAMVRMHSPKDSIPIQFVRMQAL